MKAPFLTVGGSIQSSKTFLSCHPGHSVSSGPLHSHGATMSLTGHLARVGKSHAKTLKKREVCRVGANRGIVSHAVPAPHAGDGPGMAGGMAQVTHTSPGRARRSVRLPDDIRPVLEATYADRDETGSPLALALRQLEEDKRTLRNHAYDSTAQWGNTVSEETVTTRAIQRPEADVLLLRSRGMNGGQCLLADDSEMAFPARSPEWREQARIASRLMANRPRAGKLVGKCPQAIRRPFEQTVALIVCGAEGWRAASPVHRRTQGRRHA